MKTAAIAVAIAVVLGFAFVSETMARSGARLQATAFRGGMGSWERVYQEERPPGIDWAPGLLLFKDNWVIVTGKRRTIAFDWRTGKQSEYSSPASYGVLAASGDYLWVGDNTNVAPGDPSYSADRVYKHKWPKGTWEGRGHPGGACANVFQLCSDGKANLWALFDGPMVLTLSSKGDWRQAFPPAGEHVTSSFPHISLVPPDELWISARRAGGDFPKSELLPPGITVLNTADLSVKRRLSEKDCSACYNPLASFQDSRRAVWVLGAGPSSGASKPEIGKKADYTYLSVLKDGKWSDYLMSQAPSKNLTARSGAAIAEDKNGDIWVYHGGLFRFDISAMTWYRFGEPAPQWDGFRNEMLATPDGRIWLTDRHGSVWTFEEK